MTGSGYPILRKVSRTADRWSPMMHAHAEIAHRSVTRILRTQILLCLVCKHSGLSDLPNPQVPKALLRHRVLQSRSTSGSEVDTFVRTSVACGAGELWRSGKAEANAGPHQHPVLATMMSVSLLVGIIIFILAQSGGQKSIMSSDLEQSHSLRWPRLRHASPPHYSVRVTGTLAQPKSRAMGPCGKGWSGAPSGAASASAAAGTAESKQVQHFSNPFPMCTRETCGWYTSHYCEENTLRLCGDLFAPAEAAGVELYVVFISNRVHQVPVWCQRLAQSQDKAVLWDYHVLLLAQHPHGNWIYDLDSTLPFPTEAMLYMHHAFRKDLVRVDERFKQVFRVVKARECFNHFASDRSHMIQRGGIYSARPPDHPPLRGARSSTSHNMGEWIDMDASRGRGRVFSLEDMVEFVSYAPHRYS